jgi:glyoxylase-like metal-dependent hydrolase (beta-lactamase superfamily II)
MSIPKVIPLELDFQNVPGVIASYLLPHAHGAALVESGPGSTKHTLVKRLSEHGYSPADVTDIFLTHIHLDHAGASGWLARQGAKIHVHGFGAPHLKDPTKLLASATRIYGNKMDSLWGEFLSVPTEQISIPQDGELLYVDGLEILPIETPGHASHHFVYLYEGVCFSGDVGGVRMGGLSAIRAPMPPPEFNLETWRSSLDRLSTFSISAIAPTHFGIYPDPIHHIDMLRKYLDRVENWMQIYLPDCIEAANLRPHFETWTNQLAEEDHLDGWSLQAYELANPAFMSADGIFRYWRKFRSY